MSDEPLTQWMVGIVRARMAEHGLSYADLESRLRAIGVDDNERNLRNKVMRGTFSASFWIQCLVALGVKTIDLHPDRMGFSAPPADGTYGSKGEALTEIYKVLGSGDDDEPSTAS